MSIKKSKQLPSLHIRDLCGNWKSTYRSPPIKIFRENRKYYLMISFRQDRDTTVEITCRIHRYCTRVYINYFEELDIQYDKESDQLHLAVEGKYIREQ